MNNRNENDNVIWRKIPENSGLHLESVNNSQIKNSSLLEAKISSKNMDFSANLPVFPITSPFLKERHIATKRFNNNNDVLRSLLFKFSLLLIFYR